MYNCSKSIIRFGAFQPSKQEREGGRGGERERERAERGIERENMVR